MTDLIFIFGFLPIALTAYYICGRKAQPYILAAVSLLFYACGSSQYFLLLLIALAANIACGYLIGLSDKGGRAVKSVFLALGSLINVSVLFYYKYADFIGKTYADAVGRDYTARKLILPLGLSFFVFKAISYLIDIYKGKIEVHRNPIYAIDYLSFFGQMESGPLSRYADMADSLLMSASDAKTGKQITECYLLPGMERFAAGLIKKTLLSNVLYNIVSEVFSTSAPYTTPSFLWLGSICYSLQLFFDFSGYSDMAIGVSQMFGIRCPENFDYPYTAKSVAEFWRRWHITLGAWFRDYIYIPMGGSRVSRPRLYLNLLVVWFLTGLWHGANWTFIVWGLMYFVFIAMEKTFSIPERLNGLGGAFYRIAVLLIVNFNWVIFRSASISSAWAYIRGMFISAGYSAANNRAVFLLKDYFIFIFAAVLLSMPVIPKIKRLCESKRSASICFSAVSGVIVAGLFVWAISLIAAGANNPFVYANF